MKPDNPNLIDVDYLRRLDADAPGRWLAQPKLDGWRRWAWLDDAGWHWGAKKGLARAPLPEDLRRKFEALPWPAGIGLDMEWVGPRQAGGAHSSLHLFDLWMAGGTWLGKFPFQHRYHCLANIVAEIDMKEDSALCIFIVSIRANPGLVALFEAQRANPLSEGLVIRRADSGLVGGGSNPLWFKIRLDK